MLKKTVLTAKRRKYLGHECVWFDTLPFCHPKRDNYIHPPFLHQRVWPQKPKLIPAILLGVCRTIQACHVSDHLSSGKNYPLLFVFYSVKISQRLCFCSSLFSQQKPSKRCGSTSFLAFLLVFFFCLLFLPSVFYTFFFVAPFM